MRDLCNKSECKTSPTPLQIQNIHKGIQNARNTKGEERLKKKIVQGFLDVPVVQGTYS